jgi:DnaJ-class molecular chaperone
MKKSYTEECPDCLGVGTIAGKRMLSRHIVKAQCYKCKGEKVLHFAQSPERRKYRREKAREKAVHIPVRWTPPEKIPGEYDYDV